MLVLPKGLSSYAFNTISPNSPFLGTINPSLERSLSFLQARTNTPGSLARTGFLNTLSYSSVDKILADRGNILLAINGS